jgi:hypothetical protein
MRPSLPTLGDVLADQENNATIPFNAWESWVDGLVVSLGIGVGAREPLPPNAIVIDGRPNVAYSKWLLWVNRSVATYGTPAKRPPLPPANFTILGSDRKATIPFFVWLQYVDRLLAA